MPRELKVVDPVPLSLEEYVARLDEAGFDPSDERSLINAAELLAGLAANRTFLGDILIEELGCDRSAPEATAYGPQAIMLRPPANGYFLRANIWPARGDPAFQSSGAGSFVYGLPHDHNFDFLTVGYFGPGYVSDYYEYDYESVAGEVGEQVDLRFVERSALSEGRVLHYRAHRDVHCQHPPESLSVSLNICAASPAQGWFDQYQFDLDRGAIAGVLNASANEVMLRLGVALGQEDALALAAEYADHHPSAAMRRVAGELIPPHS
ncbi:transposase [Citromicrobium bathyomarinum]|uniref:transposase n=1 Tax=Citromicrobium bathyomarinum TaxID=72174 RepID=UPI00315A46A5